ncbi:MAG: hypothetical protein ACRECH_06110 [Nitrososphaerales archaeon]
MTITSNRMITEQNAKTVYNSRVPVTIADALNVMNPVSGELSAYALTLTPVDISGIPIVIRGLPKNVISLQGFSTSQIVNRTGNIVLLGSKAQARLGAHIGDNLSIESPFASGSINVTVSGFFKTATELDYEIIVSLVLGEQIAGIPQGIANAVIIPSSIPFTPNILTNNYQLSIDYSGPTGNLIIVDSSGYVHDSTQILPSKDSNFTSQILKESLPYGLYTVLLEEGQVRTTLNEFVTAINNSVIVVNSPLSGLSNFLSVKVSNSCATQAPSLLDSLNNTVTPDYCDQKTETWIYKVGLGTYSLSFNGQSHRILVFGNTTFDANAQVQNSFLNVYVNNLGTQALGYSITVKDIQSSQIVFGSFSTDSVLLIPVEANHTYAVALLTTNSLLIEHNVSIAQNGASLTLNIPYLPQQLQNVPISDYTSLGIGFPSQSVSFNYFFGTTTASTIALFSIIIILLVLTLFALNSQFLAALQKEIQAISYMFPRKKPFFLKISGPLLLLSIASAIIGVGASFIIFQLLGLDFKLTFVGYGIQLYPVTYVAVSLISLSLLSWVRILGFLSSKVFTVRRNR